MNQFRDFKTILLTAVSTLFEVRVVLARALVFPLVFYIPLSTIGLYGNSLVLYYFQYIFTFVIGVLVAIPVHRVILIGPDSVSKWGFNKWTKRETRFILFLIGTIIIWYLAWNITTNIYFQAETLFVKKEDSLSWFNVYASLLIAVWIFSRFSLVFPSTAIDGVTSLKSSWVMTKKHQILIFLVVAFFPTCLIYILLLTTRQPFFNFPYRPWLYRGRNFYHRHPVHRV